MLHVRHQTRDRDESLRLLRIGAGLVLLAIGVTMALWAFVGAYRILTEPSNIEIFQTIVPESPELRTLDIDGKKIVLPEGLFRFMAYVIGCLLLLIAGSIGGGFISGGVNLLQFSFARLERQIKREVEGLSAKMEGVARRLNSLDKTP